MLAMMAVPGSAFAQAPSCTGQCADQAALLSTFNNLTLTAAGRALLDANLATENNIYLNSTQAEKIAAGTILMVDSIPANVLLRAFPGTSLVIYNPPGIPTATLPPSIQAMVGNISSNVQINAIKPNFGGTLDVYGGYYGYLPGQRDSFGNPPPYQVSAAILNNPFTPANSSLLAWQSQQTAAYNANWQQPGDSQTADFPSAHTMAATINAIPFAILAPGYYQQLALSVASFAYALNVDGVHYPTDVIGGRILGTYVIAQMLAGNSLYPSTVFNSDPATLNPLSLTMQSYLGGGGSSPYAGPCANLINCVTHGVIPTAAYYTQSSQSYLQFMTYGLPALGDTTLAPVVPAEAHYLIATRFPYLSVGQLNDILASTEIPSGGFLDDNSGWARLNLYAAAGGYGAFAGNVTVNMDATRLGLNAFDVWTNNISGPGGLTLQGSGTLVLAGNNTYTGGTSVQDTSTLAVTGSLLGPLSISPLATFVVGSTGTFTGAVNNSGSFDNNGIVTGVFSGTTGSFTNSGYLSGSGSFGSLTSLPGSTIAPLGTIQVASGLTLASGATYQVRVGGTASDQIQVGGTATINGGTVVASLIGNNPVLGFAYPIITANVFNVTSTPIATAPNLPFIQASLDSISDPHKVLLTLTRSNVSFASVTTSPNQAAVANALDTASAASGLGLAVTSQSPTGARQAFNALSGEAHASAQTVMLSDSLSLQDAMLGRMRQAAFAGDTGPTAALASGGPTLAYAQAYAATSGAAPASAVESSALAYADGKRPVFPIKAAPAAVPATTFWTQGVGAWGRSGSDGNAAGVSRTLAGFFSGVDRRFSPAWLAGIAGGYTHSSASVSDRASSATIETAHLAAYAATHSGSWNLRAAAASSFSTLDTSRSIAFPGFADSATAHYGAATAQLFGEVSYGVTFGKVAAEPFGGLAVVYRHTDGFAETGGTGLAALSGSATSDTIGFSTLGGRAATHYVLPGGMVLTPRVSAAWQHAVGSVTPTDTMTFQSTGAPFTTAGLPLARDTALIETGLNLSITAQARLGLTYSAQFGDHVQNNSVQGSLTWRL
jgi:subtilase-type serine protease